jgi:hypothetical protein
MLYEEKEIVVKGRCFDARRECMEGDRGSAAMNLHGERGRKGDLYGDTVPGASHLRLLSSNKLSKHYAATRFVPFLKITHF